MSENEVSGSVECCFILLFILFVFQCIALTNSDTDAFYAACGHTLRDLVMSNLIITCAAFIIINLLGCIVWCMRKELEPGFVNVYFALYLIFEVIMSICILKEGVDTLNNSVCNTAMRSTDGGSNSISANTGSALLAIIGIVPSALLLSICICIPIIVFVVCLIGYYRAV